MPSISDPQWQAIRRTAAAVAREAAVEAVKSGPALGHARIDALEERLNQLAQSIPEPEPLNMQLRLYPTAAGITVTGGSRSITVDQFDDQGRFIGTDEVVATEEGAVRNVVLDVHQAYSPHNGGRVFAERNGQRELIGTACKFDFRPTENHDPAFQAHLRSQRSQAKPKLSAPHPEFRKGTKAPPSLPTGEFFIIGDAACYAYGGSPTRNLPYLVESPGQVMHGSEEQAWAEAQRLSKEHGRPYVVLKGIGTVTPTSVPSTFNTKF